MEGTDKVDPTNFFLKIKNKEPQGSYSTIEPVIYEATFNLLQRLVDKCQSNPLSVLDADRSPDNFNGIILDIKNKTLTIPTGEVGSRIRINSDGEIIFHTKLNTSTSFAIRRPGGMRLRDIHNTIAMQMHSSKEVFKQLEEAIVYSKHTKSLPELDNDTVTCVNLFDVRYIMNDKSKSHKIRITYILYIGQFTDPFFEPQI